ncbi:hypothetical protein [Cytobacillus gottheilii]|uniref:hypothetical protein n=1 Tax=Cytobacillus gottheilii TaxID=859144 RepID=UPI0009BB2924|nr:hypothetical protein [Cytobacillus gottheilii]
MNNNRWYLSTWFICILFSLWFLIIPLIMGLVLLYRQKKDYLENSLKVKAYIQGKEEELLKRKEKLAQREKN